MANHLAIQATAKAIQRLLTEALPRGEFPMAKIQLLQSRDVKGIIPIREGLSIYLYYTHVNPHQINHLPPDGERHPPRPVTLDLHFMITPWSANTGSQLKLLGWAISVINRNPVLPAGYLNHDYPDLEVFQEDETVELVYNPMSLEETTRLWECLYPVKIIPSVALIARAVSIEPEE